MHPILSRCITSEVITDESSLYHFYHVLSSNLLEQKLKELPIMLEKSRAQNDIFLPGSNPSTFISFYTLSSYFPIYHPILSLYLSLFLSSSCPPFFPFYFPSFRFVFLPGKFQYFSYLPGSAATTLLHFFESWKRESMISC